jgi:hypothetical protein
VLVDLDEREARMLLMVRTQAAIERAAIMGARLELERDVAGLQPVPALSVVLGVGGDQGLLDAVGVAAFLEIDAVVLDQDLGWHRVQAGLAQRLGLAVEQIGLKRALLHGSPGDA